MDDTRDFDSIVDQLRKEYVQSPSDHRPGTRALWLSGIVLAAGAVVIVVSLVVNRPYLGLAGFLAMVFAGNVTVGEAQGRFRRR